MINDPNRLSTEVAHILFLDLAGYSLLPMEEQARLTQELRSVVRGTPEFVRATQRQEVLALDTGDGMALVFFRDPIATIQCAAEIAQSLGSHPRLKLRMGIHSGPVSRVSDVNGKDNVAGSGINTAQRVMDCGDPGHILLSSASADAVVVLLSEASRRSEMLDYEVQTAHQAAQTQDGKPRLLPVRLAFAGPLGEPLGAILDPLNYSLWETGADDDRVAREVVQAIQTPPLPPLPVKREPTGGAVPLDSRFYVVRPTDDAFLEAIAQQDSIVLVKGARQMGKTSLLARGLQQARKAGARVVLTDFQTLGAAALGSLDALLLTLAESIADQLDLDADPRESWNAARAPNTNMERFLRREVLGSVPEPLVWGLDEVDRLFPPACSFGSEVFGLFRSWHNRRALDPNGPWSRLTLAIAYATEAHLFITDLNQSPFNVGTRLTLDDFSQEQVGDLNGRHGHPLPEAEAVSRFYRLVGGQPYLVRRGLDEIGRRGLSISGFEAEADQDEGLFGDHLRRILITLSQDAELTDAMRGLLQGKPCPTPESFYRLRSAGLVTGSSASSAVFRCRLYESYLGRHLL